MKLNGITPTVPKEWQLVPKEATPEMLQNFDIQFRRMLWAHALNAAPIPPEGDVIARCKRILALVDDYTEKPTSDTRRALRHALHEEFTAAPIPPDLQALTTNSVDVNNQANVNDKPDDAPIPITPSATWRTTGEPDPHGNRYDCERAKLCMGDLTDDELANGAFLNYDIQPHMDSVIAGKAHLPIAWMTAVKDRIRWLSRSLEKALVAPIPTSQGAQEAMEAFAHILLGLPTPETEAANAKRGERIVKVQNFILTSSMPPNHVENLVALVGRLCRKLDQQDPLRLQATEYLRTNGLLGSPLRNTEPSMTNERAAEILKKHAALYGDKDYVPARWVIDAIQEARLGVLAPDLEDSLNTEREITAALTDENYHLRGDVSALTAKLAETESKVGARNAELSRLYNERGELKRQRDSAVTSLTWIHNATKTGASIDVICGYSKGAVREVNEKAPLQPTQNEMKIDDRVLRLAEEKCSAFNPNGTTPLWTFSQKRLLEFVAEIIATPLPPIPDGLLQVVLNLVQDMEKLSSMSEVTAREFTERTGTHPDNLKNKIHHSIVHKLEQAIAAPRSPDVEPGMAETDLEVPRG